MLHLKPHSWSLLWSKKKTRAWDAYTSWAPIPPESRSCWWWWWWSWSLANGDGSGQCLSPKTHHHLHCHVFCTSYRTYIYKKHQLVLKYMKKERKKTHWGPNDVSNTSFGSIFILPALHPCPPLLLLCWLCWCWSSLVVGSTRLWLLYLLCWLWLLSATGYCHWWWWWCGGALMVVVRQQE